MECRLQPFFSDVSFVSFLQPLGRFSDEQHFCAFVRAPNSLSLPPESTLLTQRPPNWGNFGGFWDVFCGDFHVSTPHHFYVLSVSIMFKRNRLEICLVEWRWSGLQSSQRCGHRPSERLI